MQDKSYNYKIPQNKNNSAKSNKLMKTVTFVNLIQITNSF